MKDILSKIGRAVCFLAILLGLLQLASVLFTPRDNRAESGMDYQDANGILGEAPDTIDVLVVGDSEAYSSISPMEIWQNEGITSYVCGTHGQKAALGLQFVEEVFRRQSPKVVIVETDTLFLKNHLSDYLMSRAEHWFPIFRFHDHWKTLKKSDLGSEISYTWTNDAKGYYCKMEVQAADTSQYRTPSDEVEEISLWNQVCLNKIRKLCEEHGAELLLLSTPSTKNWSYARHNGVAQYAEARNVTYLDLNLMPEEVPIDWNLDTRDQGDHVNHSGAVKVSGYLGRYLKDHYPLTDHRADPAYSSWEAAVTGYQAVIAQAAAETVNACCS